MSSQNGNAAEIIKLAARSWKSKEIADFLGVSESYVSQVLATEEAQAQIGQANIAEWEAAESFDDMLGKAEKKALEQVERSLPLMRGVDAARIFKVLNEAKRRKDSLNRRGQEHGNGVFVQIMLPAAAEGKLVMTKESQIIEVDGKPMISATPTQLDKIFEERKGKTVQDAVYNLTKRETPVEVKLLEQKKFQALEVLEQIPVEKKSRASKIPSISIDDIV